MSLISRKSPDACVCSPLGSAKDPCKLGWGTEVCNGWVKNRNNLFLDLKFPTIRQKNNLIHKSKEVDVRVTFQPISVRRLRTTHKNQYICCNSE